MRSSLLRALVAAVAVTSMALSSEAQTIGCSLGGSGGPIPSSGTGGGGTFPNTFPTAPSVFSLNVASVPTGATVVTEVKLNGITHTYLGDLQFVLTAPSGAQHNLLVRPLVGCDLGGNYVIVTGCTGGQPLPANCTLLAPGTYDQFFGTWPSGTNGINNTPLNTIPAATGAWTLTVYDWAGADVGALTSWDLCFGTPQTPSAPSVAPTLTAPIANASVFGPNVNLQWAAVACATSYQVDVDGIVYNAPTNSFAYTSTPGLHNWTVRGLNAAGNGPWAAAIAFTDLGAPPNSCNGSSLSTVFATNNGLGSGSCVFFDVNVTNPAGIVMSQLDQNTTTVAGTAFTVAVYTKPGTYAGFQQNASAWNNVANGAGVSVGTNAPSLVEFPDFPLAPGITGFCLVITGAQNSYTNGTGSNQFYSNSDLSITLGESQSPPFSGTPITPRVWNGTLRYNCSSSAPIVTYCTAGTSTNGCVPAISANVQPSVSQASACVVSVANVEGQKSGLIFYGVNNSGFAALPWATGSSSFLCVKPPTQRMTFQLSGGTIGQCDGALSQDLNTFLGANPAALGQPFAVGQKFYAQAWYRDPPAAKTTNLSNAVELTFAP